MSLQILRRQPTQTLSQQPLCLRSVLLRIREREHHKKERRAYWRRFFGLERKSTTAPGNETHALLSIGLKTDAELDPDFDGSIALSEGIIAAGVILFCVCLMICVVAIALISYLKPSPAPRRYVVQSGFVEIVPK